MFVNKGFPPKNVINIVVGKSKVYLFLWIFSHNNLPRFPPFRACCRRPAVVPSRCGALVLLPRRRDKGLDDIAGRAVRRGDGEMTTSQQGLHLKRIRVVKYDGLLYRGFVWKIVDSTYIIYK